MRVPRLRLAALALVSGIALSGCAYDMYGDGYGYGYGYGNYGAYGSDYPYGGYGYGYPYSGYGYGYPYGGYGYGGYGYGYDPFGWYGDFYYPGAGIFVYDRDRRRHEWTDDQRRYWEQRRDQWRNHHSGTTTTNGGENWSGWDRSHWQGRQGSTATTTAPTGGWRHGSGSWTRSGSESRSSVTATGEHSSRRSQERADERPQ